MKTACLYIAMLMACLFSAQSACAQYTLDWIYVTAPSCGGSGAAVYSGDTFLGCLNISGTSGIIININPSSTYNTSYRSTTSTTISQRDPTKKCGVGNPIIPSTGNKIEEETDFTSSGEMPLALTRSYNRYWQGAGVFGQYWVSNVDYKLSFGTTDVNACYPRPGGGTCGVGTNTAIYAWRPNGSVIKYIKNASDGVFYEDKPGPVAKIIQQTDGSFILYGENLQRETYSSAGYIGSVVNEQGIGWTYSYINSTYPYRITHTSGRYVEFTWTNGQLTAVRDPAGNYYGYSYTANAFGPGLHRLVATSKPGTPASTVTYHYPDASSPYLLGKSFSGVRYSTFTYSSGGYATSTEHNGLDKYSFAYTEGGNGLLTVVQTNPQGKKTTSVYKNGNITSVTGQPSTYCPDTTYALTEYDTNGYPTMKSDFNNNKTAYAFNAKGQLSQMIEAYGATQARTTQYIWDTARNRINSIAVLGQQRIEYAYTLDGRIASITETNLSNFGVANQSRVTTYAYTKHPNGMLATVTVDGPLAGTGDVSVTNYSPQGDLLSVVNSLGHTVSYSNHNGLGQPGRMTDANGGIVDLIYDAQGRIVTFRRWIAGAAADTVYGYNDQGLMTTMTAADGVVTNYEYNPAQRLIRTWRTANGTVAGGASKEDQLYTYDAMGDVIRIDNRKLVGQYEAQCIRWRTVAGETSCIEEQQVWVETPTIAQTSLTDYDDLGRIRLSSGNHGQSIRYAYDPNGNIKTISDAQYRVTTLQYDALDRLITSTDPSNGITRFEYDAGDRISKVIDARNLSTAYIYDGFGQLWAQTSPDTGSTTFQYNANGQRTLMTRNDGSQLGYQYDALGRMTYAGNAQLARNYSYDWCQSGAGKLCSVSVNDTQQTQSWTTLGYTLQGQLSVRRDSVSGSDDWTGFSYNAVGQLSGISYPSGVSAGYGYSNGKLTTMTATINGTNQIVMGAINYAPFAGMSNSSYGNNLSRNLSYDLDGRLTSISSSAAGVTAQSLGYSYNSNDEITGISNGIDAGLTQSFAYDALSRLTSAAATSNNASFGYDSIGNRTSRTENGAATSYGYPATSHQLQYAVTGGNTRSFNSNTIGNLSSWHGADGIANNVIYDAYARIDSHTRNSVTTGYRYDAFDQRVQKYSGGGNNVRYIYAGQNQLLAERFTSGLSNGSGSQWTSYLWLGGQPVGVVKGSTLYWVHADHLGRPEVVTNANKQTVWRAANYAFHGNVVIDQIGGYNLGFPGQYWDTESNLWHNGFRDYEPTLGRYIQSDPIGLAGGASTYGYVDGNPVTNTDLLGLAMDSCPAKKRCVGVARVLKGNSRHIGKDGGFSTPTRALTISKMTAAIIPSQWGGTSSIRPHVQDISGVNLNGSPVIPLFNDAVEIVGPTSVYEILSSKFPGALVIELPGADKDQGLLPIAISIPSGLPCPKGTSAL